MADAKMPYGDVEYADPGYQSDGKKRYPLDSEAHCRAAWSYINQGDNAAQYSPEHLASIKAKIKAAGAKYGITFESGAGRMEALTAAAGWYGRSESPATLVRAHATDLTIDGRTIVGLAVPFNTVATVSDDGRTSYKEAFAPGSFAVTIAQRGSRVRAHAQHRTDRLPIGKASHLEETDVGLVSHLKVSDTVAGNDVLALVRDGVMTGLSVGFRGIKETTRNRVRVRTEVALSEISVVADPAYADAQISGVRAMHDLDLDEYVEARVREMFASLQDPATLALSALVDEAPDDPHSVQSVRSIKQEITAARTAFLLRYPRG